MAPDQALERLLEGNRRFRTGDSHAWEYRPCDLEVLAQKQSPIAAIIACSDSRVAPEIVFDQPLGSIFACRVPGNVAAESSKWVVDMAVSEFQVPIVMVMGHTGCLAVDRVLKGSSWGLSGMLRLELKSGIADVRTTELQMSPERAVESNAVYAAGQLVQSTPSLQSAIAGGWTRCVAAVYEMENGLVRLLEG